MTNCRTLCDQQKGGDTTDKVKHGKVLRCSVVEQAENARFNGSRGKDDFIKIAPFVS